MKIYKCYFDDGSYCLKFSDDGEKFYTYSDKSGSSSDKTRFVKVEPLETGDTLQEVVEWCKENGSDVIINSMVKTDSRIIIGKYESVKVQKDGLSTTDLLTHIRKPKHTPEELEVLELAKKHGIKIELK